MHIRSRLAALGNRPPRPFTDAVSFVLAPLAGTVGQATTLLQADSAPRRRQKKSRRVTLAPCSPDQRAYPKAILMPQSGQIKVGEARVVSQFRGAGCLTCRKCNDVKRQVGKLPHETGGLKTLPKQPQNRVNSQGKAERTDLRFAWSGRARQP